MLSRKRNTHKFKSMFSLRMLIVVIFGLQTASLLYGKDVSPMNESNLQSDNVPYRIWPFIPRDTKGFVIILITVDAANFNRVDMSKLATRLRKESPEAGKMKAVLFDDEHLVRFFLEGKVEVPEYVKAQRGLYYRDRTRHEEYIQFSTKKGRPKNEVRIRLMS